METGWLLELLPAPGAPEWMAINSDGPFWTNDSFVALRFARKQDAEAYASFYSATAIATEHSWSDLKETE